MLKRIATVAAAITFATLTAFGTTGSAAATTVPDASCINSDPLGLVNVIVCTINTTVQVPIDLDDAVITINDPSAHPTSVLDNAELDMVESIIEHLLGYMDIEDEYFKYTLHRELIESGIFEERFFEITVEAL